MDIDPAFRERLKAIFDEFDDDGGGDIDTEELGEVMEQLGQHCTEAELHVRTNAPRRAYLGPGQLLACTHTHSSDTMLTCACICRP